MKKYLILVCNFMIAGICGCTHEDYQTDFRKFLGDREVVYTGAAKNVIVQSGNLRVGLKWKAGTDPTITKYIIFYNNKANSQVVDASTKADTIRTVIKDLNEYSYSFTIYSYDASENKSVPLEVSNVRVYGPLYIGNLLNRAYNAETPFIYNKEKGVLKLNFVTPDTINTKTVIRYTNTQGNMTEAILRPDSSTVMIRDFKHGTPIQYKSFYKPVRTALDIFEVSYYTDFPTVYALVPCDKSLFREVQLPNDAGPFSASTGISKLWDGTVGPQESPNIFLSNSSKPLPHHITFDMGTSYNNLSQIEETGRASNYNPVNFEVWGIADLTGASTALQGNDPGWPAEMQTKGWTLLQTCTRSDNGSAAKKFTLMDNPPPVRYIRIRIIAVAGKNINTSNMSELTFWNKE